MDFVTRGLLNMTRRESANRRARMTLARKSLHRQIEEAAADAGLTVTVEHRDDRLQYKLGDSAWMTPGDAARRLGVEW